MRAVSHDGQRQAIDPNLDQRLNESKLTPKQFFKVMIVY